MDRPQAQTWDLRTGEQLRRALMENEHSLLQRVLHTHVCTYVCLCVQAHVLCRCGDVCGSVVN